MVKIYTIPCENCLTEIDITEDVCGNCGLSMPGTFNIRRASGQDEKAALDQRYDMAVLHCEKNGTDVQAKLLEDEVHDHGKAVINTTIDFLFNWVVKKDVNYLPYRRQLINGIRIRSKFNYDLDRSIADSILFGSSNDIIYSALSIDETGLSSYGEVAVILKTSAIKSRTSALESNSYHFLKELAKNGWTHRDPIPPGYMCIWEENHKLSVAKLHKKLEKTFKTTEIAKLVLNSQDNRSADDFIELHIYGKILAAAIEKVRISRTVNDNLGPFGRARLDEIGRHANLEIY